jgi:ComF family protein
MVATCPECPVIRPAIRAIRSAFILGDSVRSIVHSLKYRGWHSLATVMAARMTSVEWPADVRDEVRRVVPVPVTRVRLRQRGYNQAALLAREVAAREGWEFAPDILQRPRSTGSQTTLHRSERRANVARAFTVGDGEKSAVAAEHLLLVDDVWTTGATALACADALLEAGARAVSVLTFARALPELERLDDRLGKAIHSSRR